MGAYNKDKPSDYNKNVDCHVRKDETILQFIIKDHTYARTTQYHSMSS
jgi:hypothetical protein